MGAASFWLPEQASTIAQRVDADWALVYWICVFFFTLVVGLMFWFVIRWKARPSGKPVSDVNHNTPLELFWTIIPTLLVLVLFWRSYQTYLDMAVPPDGAYEIQVTGQKWNWLFTYPEGAVTDQLNVPPDEPVILVLNSIDVLHSLYVPEARVKMDVIPGRYRKMWFEGNKPGTYDVFCTEYCGTEHSTMLSKMVVHETRADFEAWLADASDPFKDGTVPMDEVGELLYNQRGCKQCHSVDGSAGIAPTFLGLFGSNEQLADGGQVVVDENYIRESIYDPMAKITAGYDPVMPTFRGRLKDKEVDAIIAYMKTLQE